MLSNHHEADAGDRRLGDHTALVIVMPAAEEMAYPVVRAESRSMRPAWVFVPAATSDP